ncbi:MAG: NAD(P)H-binding protein [Bacteroidia bacterium]
MAKTALVFGSTGLIGSHLLEKLCSDERYDRVKIFVRRKSTDLIFNIEKVEQCIVDFDRLDEYAKQIIGDDIFICVGTTIKNVKGDKAAFRKVDFDIPVDAARLASQNNVKGFFVISSLGADAGSNNFYLKTKGEMEKAVQQFKFERLSFLRPSILLGNRNEVRVGESIAQFIMKPLAFLFIGPLKQYKPNDSKLVAMAMIEIANTPKPKLIYESSEITTIGNDYSKN